MSRIQRRGGALAMMWRKSSERCTENRHNMDNFYHMLGMLDLYRI